MDRWHARQVSADGEMSERVFHAIEVEPDWWHYSGPQWAGVMVAPWENLITAIADLIGRGEIYMLIPAAPGVPVDRAGNIWLDHEYLPPDRYLPLLIPKEAPDG